MIWTDETIDDPEYLRPWSVTVVRVGSLMSHWVLAMPVDSEQNDGESAFYAVVSFCLLLLL